MTNTTLKKFLSFLFITLLSFAAKAQTNVSGFISANTTWTLAGSPYIVVSNALVSQGVTLTINPGVVVKLDSACALQVDGEMIAIGTDTSRITFTSNKVIPQPGDWSELHFSDFAVDAAFDNSGNYLSGCIMKYCDVLYGGSLNYGEIHIESSSPYFSRCNINYSISGGVLCNASTCVIDSSAVDSCMGYGLYFNNTTQNSCGLTIQTDTIKNCASGIFLEDDNIGCHTIIKNNYFISNSPGTTLETYIGNGEITGNYFINNDGLLTANGLVNISGIISLLISGNSFINNVDSDEEGINSVIVSISANSAMISDNSFINNSISSYPGEGGGTISIGEGIDTIECNLFLNNQISNTENGAGCIYAGNNYNNNLVISHNIFDGNINSDSTSFGASVVWISSSNPGIPVTFTNNIVRNNSSPLNACCVFNPILNTNTPSLHIEQNNFTNNVSQDIIYVSGGNTGNATYNFLEMKNNNLNDPAAQYELYNNIPYGSPDLYPDSNYWGSTSTQHIDSVIYDYFDNANQSVVYYQPILTAPVVIDTTCSGGIPTGIKIVDEAIKSEAFPNPFSNSTEVMFGKELNDGEVVIYNVFGQRMLSMEHVYGNEVRIDRGNLSSGIYIYEIVGKGMMVANGKLVVE